MKTNITSPYGLLAPARFRLLQLIAAAGLLIGGLVPATSRADILYVTTGSNNAIYKITSDGTISAFASAGLNSSFGIAFDRAGNLYASNFGNSTIIKFTPEGVGSVFASTDMTNPFGLAFDSSGNLFVANKYANTDGLITIVKFTPEGVGTVFGNASAPINYIAFDKDDNLYVAEIAMIEKFTPGGARSVFAYTGADTVNDGLAFDGAGNLYASRYIPVIQNIPGYTSIEKFTPDGVGSVFATAGGIAYPYGLAFDSTGNLYASLNGYRTLAKYTPSGVDSDFSVFAYPIQPTGLAFTDDNGKPLPLANFKSTPVPVAIFQAVWLEWNSVSGRYYQIQSSLDLDAWTDVGLPETGTGSLMTFCEKITQPKKFFRVIRLAP